MRMTKMETVLSRDSRGHPWESYREVGELTPEEVEAARQGIVEQYQGYRETLLSLGEPESTIGVAIELGGEYQISAIDGKPVSFEELFAVAGTEWMLSKYRLRVKVIEM